MRSGSQGSARPDAGPVSPPADGSAHPGSSAQLHTKPSLTSQHLLGRMIEFTTRQPLRVYPEDRSDPRKSGYRSWRFNSRRTVPTAPDAPWALYLADREGHYRWLGFDLDDHEGTLAAEVAAD